MVQAISKTHTLVLTVAGLSEPVARTPHQDYGDTPQEQTHSMRVYNFCLANGQNWQLTPTHKTVDWLERFATIMRLKDAQSNGSPRLIFSREEKKKGWKLHDFGVIKFWSHGKSKDIFCALGEGHDYKLEIFKMLLSLSPVYKSAIERGGLPLHSALVQRNGRGVLLAAKSSTGKSTCCERIPSPWSPVCDDETLIVPDVRNRHQAHPFPTWSDHLCKRAENSWDVQRFFPLSTIFFLEQAERDEVIRLGEGTAAAFINESATQSCRRILRYIPHKEKIAFKKKVFENSSMLAMSVPAFVLRVSLTGKFWDEIERVLPNEG